MILCDLCGQAKDCSQKAIEGREFDICADCWQPIEERLRGKGRAKKTRETVVLPQITPQPEEPKAPSGIPPKIFGQTGLAN
jgi:ribosome-binding protein aMBF1 (putative translation factor)